MLNSLKSWLHQFTAPAALPVVKVEPVAQARLPKRDAFFSTLPDVGDRPMEKESWDDFFKRQDLKSFQRKAKDFQVVGTATGMDGAITVAAMDGMESPDGIDGFYSIAGGAPVPAVQISWYSAQGFIGYQLCGILMQHWFIDKACAMPARDAVRNGWDITRHDGELMTPELQDEFRKYEESFHVKAACVEAVRKMRGFGIRVILFEVNSPDPDYYVKPFNPDGVTPGSYKGISQVDPYWVTPELNFDAAANPASRFFYEPTYWRINGLRYHRSHLVVIKTCEVPDILKPSYYFGGIPLPQRLYERVYAAERTANEAPQLAMTKRTTVIEGVDMAAAASNPEGLKARLLQWAFYRDNYGVRISGATEKVNQMDTTLTDLDTVIMTQYQICCAIAGVPSTKMMGLQVKGGIGNTGGYEESSYHEELESIQEHDDKPIIERHTLLVMRSYICPKFNIAPFRTNVAFAELDTETAKEHAERTNLEAERDYKWAMSGAIDGLDIRNRLISDKDSGYNGIEEAEPEGPRPRQVVQPGAPTTAPNTPPGTLPTPAPEASTSTASPPQGERPALPAPKPQTGQDELEAAIADVVRAMAGLGA
jgi:hypothetical protein